MDIFVSIIVALVVLLIAGLAVGKFYNFFAKYRWALLLLALVYGVIVYGIGYWGSDYTLNASNVFAVAFQALFSAGRFFIFDSDLSLLVNMPLVTTAPYLIAYSFGGLFAMFSLATAVLSTFGGSVVMYLRCAMASAKNVFIFVGATQETLAIACDVKAKNKQATVIVADELKSLDNLKNTQKICTKNKIILLNAHLKDQKACQRLFVSNLLFRRIKKSKGKLNLLVMTANVLQNISLVADVLKLCKPNKPCVLHALTDCVTNTQALDALKAKEQWQVRLFNYEQIVAEQFCNDYHVVDVLPKDYERVNVFRGAKILLACEGGLARAMALSLVMDSQFELNYPELTLWGDDAGEVIGQLSEEAPELHKCAMINYFEQSIYDAQFFNTVKVGDFDYIILAQPDSAKNVKVAELLKDNCVTGKIFALAKETEYYNLKANGSYAEIELFGEIKRVMSKETIIEGKLEQAGIAVNKFYSGGVDDFYCKRILEQQSNKYFALNIATKLTLLNLEFCSATDKEVMTTADFKTYVGDKLEDLARQEHARWNGFHYANGYKTWELDDIPDGYDKTKCESLKLHACLVTYDELDAVSDRFADKVKNVPYGYKGYDIMLVEKIPDILGYCKLGVKIKQTIGDSNG